MARQRRALQGPRERGPAPPPRQGDSRVPQRRPAVGGRDCELREPGAEPRCGIARRDRCEGEDGVVLDGRQRSPNVGRRAAVDRNPTGRRLPECEAVDVGAERHEPSGSSVAQGVRRQAGGRGRRLRADETTPGGGRREDPLGVPDGDGRRRRLGAREARRRALHERCDAEGEPFEPPPLGHQGRVGIGGVSPARAGTRQGPGNDGESEQRRDDQRAPGREEQHRLLSQAPHEAHEGRRDANARDDRRGGETRIERAARERSVQSGDGFRGIEEGAPGEGERKQGEQEAEVRPSVRIRVGQPATEPQGPDSHVEQRDDDRGSAHRRQRKLPQPLGPGQLTQVIAQVPLEHGVRDAEGRWA